MPTVGVRRALNPMAAVILASLTALAGAGVTSATPVAAAPPRASAVGARPADPLSLELLTQSPWVTPNGSFMVKLLLPAGAPSATAVDVKLNVYDHLTARSTFEATLSGTPAGGLLDTAGPSAPTAVSGRSVSFTVPVITSPAAVSPSLDLHCETGSCSGVYPLEVSVSAARTGRTLGHLLTYLSYDELDLTTPGQPVGPSALRVAWVVPVGAPDQIGTATAGTESSLVAPKATTTAALDTLTTQLATSGVPVTVDATGRTLQALATRGGAAGHATVASLASLSSGTVDEFTTPTYVPIDAGALAGRGLTGEVQLEMSRGAGVLTQLRVHTHGGDYVVSGATGQGLGRAVTPLAAGAGVAPSALRLVVPDADLASNTDPLTYSQPFSLNVGGTTVTAAASDGHLAAHFAASDFGDPVLAANQLLADLAFIHFEEPSVDYARGVVMVPPSAWQPDAAFDAAVLHGLEHNPVVEPVTLDQYFDSVPSHSPVTSGTRRLVTGGPGPVVSTSFAHAVAMKRLAISGFGSAAGNAGGVTSALADDLLAAESSSLRPDQQAVGVLNTGKALQLQLDRIALSTENSITLTARNEPIPVTVSSSAPYTVTVKLILSSDKFTFPGQPPTGRTLVLNRSTNSVRVSAVARTSGDLPVEVTLTSPKFGLVITKPELLTVRSTATSLVGIALTGLALAVLLAWWARTWWRGRRRARQET